MNEPEASSDFKRIKYANGYPKRIEVSCYCHVTNIYAINGARPALELCKRCAGWQRFFEKQYQEECEKAGVIYMPKSVEIQEPEQAVLSL